MNIKGVVEFSPPLHSVLDLISTNMCLKERCMSCV